MIRTNPQHALDAMGNMEVLRTFSPHAFEVSYASIKDGTLSFSLAEGRAFTGRVTAGTDGLISDMALTKTMQHGSTPTNKLEAGNIGLFYSKPVTSGSYVLYVKIWRDAIGDNWAKELQLKTISEADAEAAASPIVSVDGGETFVENADHAAFPTVVSDSFDSDTIALSVSITQHGKKYKSKSGFVGVAQYPIATFLVTSDSVSTTQKLRSDIFFNYPDTETWYIDTGVMDVTIEGACKCTCGGGCGCCGGCCGGGGCCTGCCGGGGCGCGCGPPPGCCPPVC